MLGLHVIAYNLIGLGNILKPVMEVARTAGCPGVSPKDTSQSPQGRRMAAKWSWMRAKEAPISRIEQSISPRLGKTRLATWFFGKLLRGECPELIRSVSQ